MSLLENERKAEEHARTIANEAAKLTAAYPNGLAVVAVGFFAPVFAPRSPLPPTQAHCTSRPSSVCCASA